MKIKFTIHFFCFLILIYSCNNGIKKTETNTSLRFDKTKWSIKYEDEYLYRNNMLKDLISSQKINGLKKYELIDLIGQPDRIDSSYLFFKIAEQRIGLLVIHSKTLVIKLTQDSLVEWRKIHE